MKNLALYLSIFCLISCSENKKSAPFENQTSEKNKAEINKMTEEFDASQKSVTLYTTTSDLAKKIEASNLGGFENAPQAREDEISVFINPEKQFQTHVGIGGAITDASAEVFAKLSKENQIWPA